MTSTKTNFFQKTAVVIPCAILCSLLLGSAYPGIKIGYRYFDIAANDTGSQILFAGIRFMIAGIMVIIAGSLINKRFIFPDKRSIGPVMKIAFLETVGQYILFYVGLALTTGVRGAIMESSSVFMVLLMGTLVFRFEKLSPQKIIGTVLGSAGVIIVSLTGSSAGGSNVVLGDIMVLLSTVSYALAAVLLKTFDKSIDSLVISAYQFFFGGIIMTAIGLIMGGKLISSDLSANPNISSSVTKGFLVLFFLAFVSAASFSIWSILLKNNPVSKVSVFGFLNPVTGVILSTIFLNEGSGITFITIFSLIIICIGIYLVNTAEKAR